MTDPKFDIRDDMIQSLRQDLEYAEADYQLGKVLWFLVGVLVGAIIAAFIVVTLAP